MFLYTGFAALMGIAAGILPTVLVRKKEGVTYGKLDRAGEITNIFLTSIYALCAPFYIFLGMICEPMGEGIMWIVGAILSLICGSAALVCGVGIGGSVALRRRGRSLLSFALQFIGIIGIGLTFLLYAAFVGTLLTPLN